MDQYFDWDENNIRHIARHDVLPEEAEQVIANDPMEAWEEEVKGELRQGFVGVTNTARYLAVVTTWRADRIRIVTAFDAPPYLRRRYFSRGAN